MMRESQVLKEAKRFKLKVGVFLVLLENNMVLLSRRYNTGIADGQHVLPMGGLEEGETLTQALIREAKEEANLDVQSDKLRVVHVMHRLHHLPNGDSFPQIDVFFIPCSYDGVIQNMEPHKCDELKFYPLNDLPCTIEPFIKQALLCIQTNQFYSEIGWPENRPLQAKSECIAEALSPQIYEVTARTYDQYRNADTGLVDGIERHLQASKNGKYLDIGCGSGNYTLALLHRGINIEGVDLSHSMLAQASAKAPSQRWSQGDMNSLPFDSCMFDGAITMNTLHYVRNSLVSVFQEIRRILKPGARLVIYVIALEQCLQFWLGHYFSFFREIGHKVLASRDVIVAALQEADFLDLSIEPFFVTEHTTDLFTYACKYRPHLFLDPKIRAGMTPLQLPEYEKEVQTGCERLQKDIASGAIYRVIGQHESQLGEGLFILARKKS